MEDISATRGLRAWRPWLNKCSSGRKSDSQKPYERTAADKRHFKVSMISHPVKLFWPKSQCFDYLYQDAEILLRNYPVQATISLYEDTETEEESDDDEADDDDDDDEEEEEEEKELN